MYCNNTKNTDVYKRQVYEGIYYAVGADIIGGAVAAILAVTVLKSALNGPSMWFLSLIHI